MNDMFLPLRRYFDFKGRSRRREFWLWTLFTVIAGLVLGFVDDALGLGGSMSAGQTPFEQGLASARGGPIASAFSLATLVPGIAVSVRRLHDIGRTGWWVLAPIVPILVGAVVVGISLLGTGAANPGAGLFVGAGLVLLGLIVAIVMLVWYCTDGQQGSNRFGANPKDPDGDLEAVFR